MITMDVIYILHAEHRDLARPMAEPIKLSWSISRSMTIRECEQFAEPKDPERFELHRCWIEVRYPPISMRVKK